MKHAPCIGSASLSALPRLSVTAEGVPLSLDGFNKRRHAINPVNTAHVVLEPQKDVCYIFFVGFEGYDV